MRVMRLTLTLLLMLLPALAASPAFADSEVNTSNSSKNNDTTSGGANAQNSDSGYVGHNSSGDTNVESADHAGDGTHPENYQEGDNTSETTQTANAKSGTAVGGQVVGGSAEGDFNVNATNSSDNVDVTTGDATASNFASTFVGLLAGTSTNVGADHISGVAARNLHDGDNSADLTQSANAVSGDGVAGQILAPSASAGGSVGITASNRTVDSSVTTGDADAINQGALFVGLLFNTGALNVATDDISDSTGTNVQNGDNEIQARQTADASTGDGLTGQIIGAQSAGGLTVDAANVTADSEVDTGDGLAVNEGAGYTGLATTSQTTIVAADDVDGVVSINLQDGDNTGEFVQLADASSGNAISGQILGATAGAGQTNITLSNSSDGSDASSGDAAFHNLEALFVGLGVATNLTLLS